MHIFFSYYSFVLRVLLDWCYPAAQVSEHIPSSSIPPQDPQMSSSFDSSTPTSVIASSTPVSFISLSPSNLSATHADPIQSAFRAGSDFQNDALAELCRLIKESYFVLRHETEPSISDDEGQALLSIISRLPGCPSIAMRHLDRSIYTLLVDRQARRCLICQNEKATVERAIGCIRSHFNHRPFVCRGEVAGCMSCKKYAR